jgi:hypothetical protein
VYPHISLANNSPLSVPIFGLISTGSLLCTGIVLTGLALSYVRVMDFSTALRRRHILAASIPFAIFALIIACLPFWWLELGRGSVVVRSFSRDLLPHTTSSLTDADQMDAFVAGITVLWLGLYDIFKHVPRRHWTPRWRLGTGGIELQDLSPIDPS